MARVISDYKTCKLCMKPYKLAWWQSGRGWKLVKAATDESGKLIRRTVTRTNAKGQSYESSEPVPAEPIQVHICGSEDGFGGGKDLEFKASDFDPFKSEPKSKPVTEEKQGPYFAESGFKYESDDLIKAESKERMIKGDWSKSYPTADDMRKAIEATEGSEGQGKDSDQGKEDSNMSETQSQSKSSDKSKSSESDALAAIIAMAVEPHLKAAVESDEVRALIAEEIAKVRADITRTEEVLVIKRAEDDSEIKRFESSHPKLAALIKVVQTRKPDGGRLNAYLYGPPGSSKTTSARQVSEALSLTYSYISLNPQTADSRVSGFLDANGIFRETSFYHSYVNGGVFCIDEIDNASDNLLTALNSAIDNGHAAFPCGQVTRHSDFVLIATANTTGRGGDLNHAGRRPLDAATLERFVFMHWPYDEALEEKMTLSANENARPWLTWIRSVRVYASQNHPRLVVSPRASLLGACLLKSGAFEDLRELANSVLFKGLDADSTAKILRACPFPRMEVRK